MLKLYNCLRERHRHRLAVPPRVAPQFALNLTPMSEQSAKKPLQRILTVLFGLAFLGSTGFGLLRLFVNPVKEPEAEPSQETAGIDPHLTAAQDRERGYRKVLEREPENKFALDGLAVTRLQMQDYQGAIQPIEQLLELEPENPRYLQALVDTRLKINDYQGAIKPMYRLVQLYPEDAKLKELLAEIETKASQENSGKLP